MFYFPNRLGNILSDGHVFGQTLQVGSFLFVVHASYIGGVVVIKEYV